MSERPSEKELQTQKVLGLLGFARKAGRLVIGTELVCNAVRSGKVKTMPRIVLLAADASANTQKRVTNLCKYYECECATLHASTAELGHQIGKQGAVSTVGVADDGFTKAIRKLL